MFQKSIIDKYMKLLDKGLIEDKYTLFQKVYGNPEKQENIRNSKEEQYQEGFIRDLFCSVLGYTIKPEANYNILTELKNETKNKNNARKADGAIVINETVKAVIELKGTDTQDLDGVAKQAFDYKSHHENCNYVIISNFERLRLYVETQSDYTEFDLFNLSKDSFDLLYLLLHLDSMTNDIPQKLKHETLTEEKEITNNFYADYSTFKRALFEDLCENNPDTDKLLLFKKTQKLLDRILFILFCEDRNLLPANSTIGIINDYKKLKELGYYQSLYNVFKTFFDRIDKGFKHEKDNSRDVFAYNGGLFKTDEILDSIKVGDDVLFIHAQKLANYDFESQISVDILGRIFENSLTEIEEVQNEIENEKNGIKTENNNIGKRKKDGVFYTPEYITRYIVENTIGSLCEKKRVELKINDEEYSVTGKKGKAEAARLTELENRLEDYRKWLLSLKILDPACGSGAFLNAALKKLRQEHTLIDYYHGRIRQNEMNFSEIDNAILENNIYGVDINEESVEIAKLSLWLSTAKKNRKLSTLANNIKCGNSLISDPSVAGDKAFDWKKEFPDVFEKGGFDVVIGNPPYVPSRSISEAEKKFYYKHFTTTEYQINTYALFMEKIFSLLKVNGFYGMIIPNYWLSTKFDKALRNLIFCKKTMISLLNTYNVFSDAVVDTVIPIGKNCKEQSSTGIFSISRNCETIFERLRQIDSKKWSFTAEKSFSESDDDVQVSFSNTLSLKADKKLGDYFSMYQGMKPYEQGKGNPPQTKEMMKARIYNSDIKVDETYLPLFGAGNIQRYYISPHKEFIKYGQNLAAPRKKEIFEGERILANRILSKECLDCCFINYTAINNTDVFNLIPKEKCPTKVLFAVLASRLCAFYLKSTNVNLDRAVFPKVNVNTLEDFPIPDFLQDIEVTYKLSSLADKMLSLNEDLQKKVNRFIGRIKETYNLEKTTQNIENFYNLSFADFVKELSKQKVKLSMKQKDELEDYFNEYVKDISALNEQISRTDAEINTLVYKLYGLTDEEIKVVEENK